MRLAAPDKTMRIGGYEKTQWICHERREPMMNPRRINLTVAAAAGGLLAAALLPMAVAAADEYVYEPDVSTFYQISNPISLPPLFDEVTGDEDFYVVDTTMGTTTRDMYGNAVITTLLGSTETQFHVDGDGFPSVPGVLDAGSDITLWQLPFGFGNELVSSSSVPLGLEDIVITPFGDFTF